jgi:hypothetical protein
MPKASLLVISGGQTGVDRAALDVAIELGIEHGGWCPRGRTAEDGALDARYRLRETESAGYRQRTRMNVADSDGTLIINEGELSGGTSLTAAFAERLGRPYRVLQIDAIEAELASESARAWMRSNRVNVLNVAGPGERRRPGIYGRARSLLASVLCDAAT